MIKRIVRTGKEGVEDPLLAAFSKVLEQRTAELEARIALLEAKNKLFSDFFAVLLLEATMACTSGERTSTVLVDLVQGLALGMVAHKEKEAYSAWMNDLQKGDAVAQNLLATALEMLERYGTNADGVAGRSRDRGTMDDFVSGSMELNY